MNKYLDIELFSFNRIEKKWWNITFLRIASGNWSYHIFMVEENLDGLFIEWFKLNITK